MENIQNNPASSRRLLSSTLLILFGLLVLVWALNTPAGLLGKADAVGYAVCHRIEVRSFFLGERQLPVCARCSGMYLGSLLAMLYFGLRYPGRGGLPSRKVMAILALFVFAFALDGLNSFASLLPGTPALYTPNNALRLITGTGMGIVIAAYLYPAFNQSVWKVYIPASPLERPVQLIPVLLLGVVQIAAVLSENSLLLYPLALLSAASVLVILMMAYTMLWLMVLRRENRATSLPQMVLPLIAGLFTALLQIALIDLGRFWLTGTWSGFHLG